MFAAAAPSSPAVMAEKLLGADLIAIGNEASKRRLAPLKEIVDRAQQQLQAATKSAAVHASDTGVHGTDHVWYAFAMAARAFSGQSVLVANACQSLGKAAGIGLVPVVQVPVAVQMLSEIVIPASASNHYTSQNSAAIASSDVELRVLQAVAQLSSAVEDHPALQLEPLTVLFYLFSKSHHAAVRSAARAAVAQISETVLRWLVDGFPAAPNRAGNTSTVASQHQRYVHDASSSVVQTAAAAAFFRDCVAMLVGRPIEWLHKSASMARGEASSLLPADILLNFLQKALPATSAPTETAAGVLGSSHGKRGNSPVQSSSGGNYATEAPASALFARCVNDCVNEVLLHGISCLPQSNAQFITGAEGEERAELFSKTHRIVVTIVTRHIDVCSLDTIQAALTNHAKFVSSGGRFHASSVKSSDAEPSTNASVVTPGAESGVGTIVAAWRKALSAPDFLARLALQEGAGTHDVDSLLNLLVDVSATNQADFGESTYDMSSYGHQRTASESSIDGRNGSWARDASLTDDRDRRQQQMDALAEIWGRSATTQLLEAPPVLLESLLLHMQREQTASAAAAVSRASPSKKGASGDHAGAADTGASRGSFAPGSENMLLVNTLIEYCTMLTQSLTRWFEAQPQGAGRNRSAAADTAAHTDPSKPLRSSALVIQTFKSIWAPVYSCCSLSLQLLRSDESLHSVLKILTHLAHCATLSDDSYARDAVLRLIADNAAKSGAAYVAAASTGGASKPVSHAPSGESFGSEPGGDAPSMSPPLSPGDHHGSMIPLGAASPAALAQLQRAMHLVSAIVSISNAVGDSLLQGWFVVVESLVAEHERFTAIINTDPKCVAAQDLESVKMAIASIFDTALRRSHGATVRTVAECLAGTGGEHSLPPIIQSKSEAHRMAIIFRQNSVGAPAAAAAADASAADIISAIPAPDSDGPVSVRASPNEARISAKPSGHTITDPLQRSAMATKFIVKAFAGLIASLVPPAPAGTGPDVAMRCAVVAVHVLPFARIFAIRACSTPGYPDDLVTCLVTTLGDVVASTAAAFALTDGQSEDPRSNIVDNVVGLLGEVFLRSDSLFSASTECGPSEARSAVLKEVVRIVQTRSHALRTKRVWRSLFSVIEMATATTANDVAVAYRLLELVRSNAVTQIADSETLNSFVGCVGRLIRQNTAPDRISLNLSAVQLLWSLADFAASTRDEESGSALIWNRLLVALRDGADDERLEVKHSCLKSLFSLLISHSQHLPSLCWPVVCWQIMLPLVERHVVAPGLGTGKQTDDVKVTVIEGVSRVVRMYHVPIAISVADASLFNDRAMQNLFKCVGGACSESVTFSAVKAIGGMLVDLAPYPKLFTATAIDSAYLAFEQLVETSRQPPPAAATVSLNSLKCAIESAVDALVVCRDERSSATLDHSSAPAWSEASEEAFFHRLIAMLEAVGSAHAVITTFMFPCSVHVAIMQAVTRLTTTILDPSQARQGPPAYSTAAWQSLMQLVAGVFPTAECVSNLNGTFPKQYHPHYLAAMMEFAVGHFVPSLPSWHAFMTFATMLVRSLGAVALIGFQLPASVPVALATAAPHECQRAALLPSDFTDSAEGRLTVTCVSRLSLLWTLASAVGESAKDTEAAVELHFSNVSDDASPSSPRKNLPRSSFAKLLAHRAVQSSDQRLLVNLIVALANAIQHHLEKAAQLKKDAPHATLLVVELLRPMTSQVEALSWCSALTEEQTVKCVDALLRAAITVSACGPSDCPSATQQASTFLLDFDTRCRGEGSGATRLPLKVEQAASAALTSRALSILDVIRIAPTPDDYRRQRKPLLDALTWIASQPSTSAGARRRLAALAPGVVALIGLPHLSGDLEAQQCIQRAMVAVIALISE